MSDHLWLISRALGVVPEGETVISVRSEDGGHPRIRFGQDAGTRWSGGVIDVYILTFGPASPSFRHPHLESSSRKSWRLIHRDGLPSLLCTSEDATIYP